MKRVLLFKVEPVFYIDNITFYYLIEIVFRDIELTINQL